MIRRRPLRPPADYYPTDEWNSVNGSLELTHLGAGSATWN